MRSIAPTFPLCYADALNLTRLVFLSARYVQSELVPKIKDQDRSQDLKRICRRDEIGRQRSADKTDALRSADNPEHNCPQNRQMRMQQRLRDAARRETDNNVPNKMKHSSSQETQDPGLN